MEATFYVRNVYGEDKFYPANPAAKAVASIAGTKTLRKSDMRSALDLGVDWVQVPDPAHAPAADFLTAP